LSSLASLPLHAFPRSPWGPGRSTVVYHFALPELIATIKDVGSSDGLELVEMMVAGRRLKDIADLPLDLAI
jgi:hypothetical protein